jgi:hypothetical protein
MASIIYKGQNVINQNQFIGSIGGFSLTGISTSSGIAYSTTKIVSTYTGDCLKARRSSDNATLDIGFSGNSLDTASLLSFVGSGDGFVERIYNQFPLAPSAAYQTDLTKQPKIVSAGSVIVSGAKPSMLFDGSNDFLTVDNYTLSPNYTVGITFEPTSTITASSGFQALFNSSLVVGSSPEGGMALGAVTGSFSGETLTLYSFVISPSFVIPAKYITVNISGVNQFEWSIQGNSAMLLRDGVLQNFQAFNSFTSTNRIPDIIQIGAPSFSGKMTDFWSYIPD